MALLLIAQAEQPSNTAPMSLSGSAPDNEGSEQAYSDGPAVVPQVSESASGQPRSHEADSNVTIFNNEGLKPADSFGVTSAEGGQSGSSDINAASEQASNVTLTAAGDGPIISNENLTETGAAVPDGISAGSGQVATASGGGLTAPPDLIQAPRDPGDGGGQPLSAAVGMPAQPAGDMSVKDMFLGADPIVQGVMVILLLASMATWMVILEKAFVLSRAFRLMNRFKKAAIEQNDEIEPDDFPQMAVSIVRAGIIESQDSVGRESRADFRERMEKAMRQVLAAVMRRLGKRSLVLATIGSVSPFVGLFGTVWGIMHSFIGIAASGETTLAVVAPGIAEALFATAMGLVAAIPAVIAYNKITGSVKEITLEGATAVSLIGNHLARLRYGRMEEAFNAGNDNG